MPPTPLARESDDISWSPSLRRIYEEARCDPPLAPRMARRSRGRRLAIAARHQRPISDRKLPPRQECRIQRQRQPVPNYLQGRLQLTDRDHQVGWDTC
jgi:hypothetical protein